MIRPISLDECSLVGDALSRPETVLVFDDRVLVSDAGDAALAEVLPDGTVRRRGRAPGQTNGLAAFSPTAVVFTVFDRGQVCVLDLDTDEVSLLADTVGDAPLGWPNFPLTRSDGTLWVSCTTAAQHDPRQSVAHLLHDGSIVRIDPGGTAIPVVTGLPFPNCMTLDTGEDFLYLVRSTLSDVARYHVEFDGGLTFTGRYGPGLGQRESEERGDDFVAAAFDPVIGRRWALADGCAFDAEGNLWVTLVSANRIVAITPGGDVVTVLDDPDGKVVSMPTSVAWGGPHLTDLYVGSLNSPHLVKARSPVAGMPLWHQRSSLSTSEKP